MPDIPTATLRIQGISDVPVEQVQAFLSAISHCYDSIYAFDVLISRITDQAQRYVERGTSAGPFWPSVRYRHDDIALLPPSEIVPAGSHLILQSVSLHSPGFWDFLGTLNPLEVIRLFLIDHHERRKDREYRENAEREKLRLENELLRSKVYDSQLSLLRKLGVTNQDLAPFTNRLIHNPLDSLGLAQDRGLISQAEIIEVRGVETRVKEPA